jgi:uncharacterized protein GlcG (DUF336 family)
VHKILVPALYAALIAAAPSGGSRGGIPLVDGGTIIGAIGCSGGTGSQDEVACKAGVAALQK